MRHFVDARQKELGSAVDVTQFYFNAQTCSSIGTSSFEIALVGNLYCHTLVIILMWGRTPYS